MLINQVSLVGIYLESKFNSNEWEKKTATTTTSNYAITIPKLFTDQLDKKPEIFHRNMLRLLSLILKYSNISSICNRNRMKKKKLPKSLPRNRSDCITMGARRKNKKLNVLGSKEEKKRTQNPLMIGKICIPVWNLCMERVPLVALKIRTRFWSRGWYIGWESNKVSAYRIENSPVWMSSKNIIRSGMFITTMKIWNGSRKQHQQHLIAYHQQWRNRCPQRATDWFGLILFVILHRIRICGYRQRMDTTHTTTWTVYQRPTMYELDEIRRIAATDRKILKEITYKQVPVVNILVRICDNIKNVTLTHTHTRTPNIHGNVIKHGSCAL